jgi:hypothetical protein
MSLFTKYKRSVSATSNLTQFLLFGQLLLFREYIAVDIEHRTKFINRRYIYIYIYVCVCVCVCRKCIHFYVEYKDGGKRTYR